MISKLFRNLAAAVTCCIVAQAAVANSGGKSAADDSLLGAYDAYRAGDPVKFAKHAAKLEGHLLEPWLEQAWDDATVMAIAEQERAGLDIITDGEMRRESYSNRFATALDGVDMDNHGTALDRSGEPVPVPRVVGPISRRHCGSTRLTNWTPMITRTAVGFS